MTSQSRIMTQKREQLRHNETLIMPQQRHSVRTGQVIFT